MSHEILSIIITMLGCIGQIAFLCIAGYIAAVRGVLDVKCRKQVNKLNVGLFTPAFLFGKVAFSLTPEKLASMRAVPVGFLIVSFVSALSGWGLASLFRVNTSQRAIIISGAMFMNTNSIPVALIQSLSSSLPILKAGPDDIPEDQLGRCLSYLLIYGILGSFVRWSIGVKLFGLANDEMQRLELVDEEQPPETQALNVESRLYMPCHSAPTIETLNSIEHNEGADERPFSSQPIPLCVNSGNSMQVRKSSLTKQYKRAFQLLTRKPLLSGTDSLPCDFQGVEVTDASDEVPKDPSTRRMMFKIQPATTNRGSTATEQTLVGQTIDDVGKITPKEPCVFQTMSAGLVSASRAFREVVNPPLISAMAAVIVACIPPAQKFIGNIEALRHLLNIVGNVSIPLTLVALGAYFHQPKTSKGVEVEDGNSKVCNGTVKRRSRRELQTVILTVVSRQLIAPLILIPTLACFVKYSDFTLTKDPIFLMTAALVIGGPPATTLAQMTSQSCPSFDWVISRLLFWSFACVTPVTTIALASAAIYIQLSR